jgi:hypothetical protein
MDWGKGTTHGGYDLRVEKGGFGPRKKPCKVRVKAGLVQKQQKCKSEIDQLRLGAGGGFLTPIDHEQFLEPSQAVVGDYVDLGALGGTQLRGRSRQDSEAPMGPRILSAAGQRWASGSSPPRELPEYLMLPVFAMAVVVEHKGFWDKQKARRVLVFGWVGFLWVIAGRPAGARWRASRGNFCLSPAIPQAS